MPRVYREPLSPLEQITVTPKWPDFVILREPGWVTGIMTWYAVTHAGRPGQPYFWRPLVEAAGDAADEELTAMGRQQLDEVYAKAHPNGCPKVGH